MSSGSGLRCVLGGILMGLANLVPGISGGTMLLAVGIYRQVIEAIADLVSWRRLLRSGIVLALVVLPAVVAIVALSSLMGITIVVSTPTIKGLGIPLRSWSSDRTVDQDRSQFRKCERCGSPL